MHALFDSTRAANKWRIHARMLREYIEFFGARTEQLDMFLEEDRFTFTSYTEKIVHNKGWFVLRCSLVALSYRQIITC